MSLRYVLLGLLVENSGHGYGLRKKFLNRLGHFRNINEGQLYTELSKMEKDGLVEREVVVPDKGPARKVLHITAEGARLFRDWLLSDQYEDDGVLYDFVQGFPFFTKVNFFRHLDPAEVIPKIERQIGLQERKKEAYGDILAKMERRKVDPFRTRILAFGLSEIENRIRWLEALKVEMAGRIKEVNER